MSRKQKQKEDSVFKGTLESLMADRDGLDRIVRSLIEAFERHGGSEVHLNNLLRAIEAGDTEALDTLVRSAIGGPWKLVGEPFDLGEIDGECAPIEFLKKFPSVGYNPNAFPGINLFGGHDPAARLPWSESRIPENRLAAEIKYVLHHSNGVLTVEEVWQISQVSCFAGWRELFAFLSTYPEVGNYEGFKIIAPGSGVKEPKSRSLSFPVVLAGRDQPVVSATGFLSPDTHFGLNCFFLKRVQN